MSAGSFPIIPTALDHQCLIGLAESTGCIHVLIDAASFTVAVWEVSIALWREVCVLLAANIELVVV